MKNKQVFGHQFLCVMLSCSQKSFIYHIERYVQGAKSKIERVCEIVDSLPVPKGEAYGLCDSWFTSEKVINAHFKSGYNLIGALKTNRIIYPQGIRIQVKNFAQYVEKSDVCLVTVNSSKYWVYR
ncbi:MAG TPA: IS701 family transposase, partial [Bacteroidales bacterium]|nr:IS701 family transposase [Bacteroidales bacterium]